MKRFMDDDFLLENEISRDLYESFAKDAPIFDYHCHLVPEEIARDKKFKSITELWLAGDHYKWRQMRTYGVSEDLITGGADDFSKFLAWAETMENLIGNPLYHWTHLELRRFFGIDLVLNRKNAKAIFDAANKKLREDESLSIRGIMKKFNVYAVGTTDDPVDDLRYHKQIASSDFPAKVIPSFRPDKAINIEKADFPSYVARLEAASGLAIGSAQTLVEALERRLDYFIANGCLATDHAIEEAVAVFVQPEEADLIFQKALDKRPLSEREVEAYKTYVLTELAKLYSKRNIVMQLHISAIRDNNKKRFDVLGPDTGFDAAHDAPVAKKLSAFLSNLSETGSVPKTILYSLNPKDYYSLASLMGCFQDNRRGRLQLGSGWWFCDHKDGMETQMRILGNLGMLPLFVGMLTDSRSFLSYPRHEYFRRILCNIIGKWAYDGEIPYDRERLGGIVRNICFYNAKNYFEN